MCAIIGIASTSPISDRGLLTAQCDTMYHRGPDDAGEWWSKDGRIGLAHRRLAIIDLSPGGHQPMSDVTGKFTIVFNGELYNYQDLKKELELIGHRFRTSSDTEVILEAYRAWGTHCLNRFIGMFAFALYDSVSGFLFLARDRAGEKPLFYYHVPGKLVFSSELKALMADPSFPRKISVEALDYYLTYGYVPGNKCILKGVRKLGQGQFLIYDDFRDTLQILNYWQLPESEFLNHSEEEFLTDELEQLLTDSVRRQLVADVPVGILLSGGIDSSLVTAMAARISSRPVKTFTITFPDHRKYDEGFYARIIADYFGTEHTEMAAEPATVELLPALAHQYDEPIADSSMVPTFLVSRLIRKHAKVALGGDGGDELFGGYPHYSWIQWQERSRRYIPKFIRNIIGIKASVALPAGFKGRNHLIGFTADVEQSIAHINMYFDASIRRKLLSPFYAAEQIHFLSPEQYKMDLCKRGRTPLRNATMADFKTYLVEDILVKVDRASMLNSLEVRAPWLDYRIIEFAFTRVPDQLKATDTERKILPRRLAERILPGQLDLTRKQGFSMPLSDWFKGEWGSYMESVLCGTDTPFFNKQVIRDLISGQRKGFSNTSRLFALVIFELWRKEYKIDL